MTPATWQADRGELNHDWLKNRFLLALDEWLGWLRGELVGEYDPDPVLAEWADHRGALAELLDGFEREMSPAALFEPAAATPLARCRPATRRWLQPLARSLWLARYPVRGWLVHGYVCLKAADEAYHRAARVRTEPAVRAFRDACAALSAALSRFPSRVLPT